MVEKNQVGFMSIAQVNYLNIGLMLISCVLAYWLPFELFLFSYVIMGPLHYLTEIGWLHQRSYFTKGSGGYWILGGICAVMFVFYLLGRMIEWGMLIPQMEQLSGMSAYELQVFFMNRTTDMIIMAFVAALSLVLFRKRIDQWIFILLVSGAIFLFSSLRPELIVFGALLPTVIHVSVFMLFFILYGSMKSKSISGYLSVLVFVVISMLFFIYEPIGRHYTVDNSAVKAIDDGEVIFYVNSVIMGWFGQPGSGLYEIASTKLGVTVMRFMAFSYTYHYLNWFSKTKVINWHQIPRSWAIIMVFGWIFFVILYMVNFKMGITVIFFLSLLHVFLEFPLNYKTMIGVGEGVVHFFQARPR